MLNPSLVGVAVLGTPAVWLAWVILWRRLRPVFWFALALIAIGLGYLTVTGATADVGAAVLSRISLPGPAPANLQPAKP